MQQYNLLPSAVADGLTDEQAAIVSRDFSGKDSCLVVQAYAGTGKTHTLYSFARAHSDATVHYLAFNRSMKEEAERKFRGMKNVRVTTLHGLAYADIGRNFRDRLGEITPVMLKPLVKKFFPSALRGDASDYYNVAAAVRDCFTLFLGSSEKSVADCFAARKRNQEFVKLREHGLDLDRLAAAVDMLWKNMTTGKGPCGKDLCMTHNCYLKMYQLSAKSMGSDFVLIDEAQDVTDCMIGIVEQQAAHKIFIGDSYQQIYAWNGAVNSLRKLEEAGADVLYLTQSFRCPPAVARVADKYLRVLNAKKSYRGSPDAREKGGATAILARSNASVFRESYNLLRKGLKPGFLGGFAGYGFEVLLDIWKIFGRHPEKVYDPWLKSMAFRGFDDLVSYADEHDPFLAARCNLVKSCGPDVYAMYNALKKGHVETSRADVVFSTVHKAKGAEWDKVILLDDFADFEKILNTILTKGTAYTLRREELNLLYVATTRSRHGLRCPSSILLSDGILNAVRERIRKGQLKLVD